MSTKTTRRGLFTLALATVGAGALVAAKPVEAPAPPAGSVPLWHLWLRLRVKSTLSERGLDPTAWSVEMDYDPDLLCDRLVVSSTAYRDGTLTYTSTAVHREGEEGFGYPASQETVDMIVDGLARTIEGDW